jgi:hypothetical protein
MEKSRIGRPPVVFTVAVQACFRRVVHDTRQVHHVGRRLGRDFLCAAELDGEDGGHEHNESPARPALV